LIAIYFLKLNYLADDDLNSKELIFLTDVMP